VKRFIDLQDQLYASARSLEGEDREFRAFAWYDTIIDEFEVHSDCQTWTYWKEFERDFCGRDLDRYRNLAPDWVFDEP
jgi:hypothetical protein